MNKSDESLMAVPCRICRNFEGNRSHVFREMMFGSREEFSYTECGNCGCLQIEKAPTDMERFYGDGYYSYADPLQLHDNAFKAFCKRLRLSAYLGERKVFSEIFLKLYPPPDYFSWFERTAIAADAEVLDVGCGAGHLLIRMRRDGFAKLTGIDPHVRGDIHYNNGVVILKKNLAELDRKFDLIMLHHSFEHMADPLAMLKKLYSLLRRDRYLLIRIPVAGTFAWREYERNWVQIDAPRHLFLHTVQSMKILAGQAGFETRDIVFDSTGFQFWGSEQYRADIPLRDNRSHAENPRLSMFTREQLRDFDRRAGTLNREQDGDQASFYLYKG